jgi:hypothetical protein
VFPGVNLHVCESPTKAFKRHRERATSSFWRLSGGKEKILECNIQDSLAHAFCNIYSLRSLFAAGEDASVQPLLKDRKPAYAVAGSVEAGPDAVLPKDMYGSVLEELMTTNFWLGLKSYIVE